MESGDFVASLGRTYLSERDGRAMQIAARAAQPDLRAEI